MTCARCGSPFSTKYWRASLSAASIASEPPDTKYTLSNDLGARAISASASASIGSLVKNEVCANGSFSSWRWMAVITAGSEWPRQDTAAPPEASR
jgi:hypothetical protein